MEIWLNNTFKSSGGLDYFDQFGSNTVLVSIVGKTETSKFMIYGFSDLWNPFCIHFTIPNYFKNTRRCLDLFEYLLFIYLRVSFFEDWGKFVYISVFCFPRFRVPHVLSIDVGKDGHRI